MEKISRVLFLFLFFPLVIGVESSDRDSTVTNFKIAGGLGSYAYVTRGCEGQVLSKEKVPFQDAGFSIDHKFEAPLKIGLRAGYILDRQPTYINNFVDRGNYYINPDISFESKWIGLGAGPFFAKDILYGTEGGDWGSTLPSWHLRFGTQKSYLSIHMLENLPLYSGGDYINIGFGTVLKPVSWWIGLGITGPYDNVGFVTKTSWRIHRNWYLDIGGRLGGSEGIPENAVSLGLNYRLFGKKSSVERVVSPKGELPDCVFSEGKKGFKDSRER